jgi:hypothetical protein
MLKALLFRTGDGIPNLRKNDLVNILSHCGNDILLSSEILRLNLFSLVLMTFILKSKSHEKYFFFQLTLAEKSAEQLRSTSKQHLYGPEILKYLNNNAFDVRQNIQSLSQNCSIIFNEPGMF